MGRGRSRPQSARSRRCRRASLWRRSSRSCSQSGPSALSRPPARQPLARSTMRSRAGTAPAGQRRWWAAAAARSAW
eukprot:scaffold5648_cov101-Isochrysis_galbana.AAC.3